MRGGADGATEGDGFAAELVVADRCGGLEGNILPTDRGFRCEVCGVVAKGALDGADGVLQVVLLVGAHGDEQPVVEDVRTTLNGLVGRCGLVSALLEVGAPNALLEVRVHLEVVSDLFKFGAGALLVLRRDVRGEVELDVSQLEEVAEVAISRIVGVLRDVERRRPLVADVCRACLPLDGGWRNRCLV